MRRKPIRVLTSEEADAFHKGQVIPKKKNENTGWLSMPTMQNLLISHPGLFYTELTSGDERMGKLISNCKSKKARNSEKKILLEGKLLVKDALLSGAKCHTMLFTSEDQLTDLLLDESVTLYQVHPRAIALWSDVGTPQGLIGNRVAGLIDDQFFLGIFSMPKAGEAVGMREKPIPMTMICDQVRDPGNMGSIIRIGASLGIDRILVTKGSVDVWEPKVIRSAMGGHFRVPILNHLPWEHIPSMIPANSSVFVALNERHLDPEATANRKRELLEELTAKPKVPEYAVVTDAEGNEIKVDPSYGEENDFLKLYQHRSLDTLSYDKIDCRHSSHVTLIVGGETEGISRQAYKLAFDKKGATVTIPLSNGMDSLNASVAAAILGFEMKKQLAYAVTLTSAESSPSP